MTEAQEVENVDVPAAGSSRTPAQPSVFRRVEMEGRSWTIVDLGDGMSWDVYSGEDPDGARTPRIAHVTVSERGYFSTDVPGVIRGPYTTLDEAVYPIALDKRVLLDAPEVVAGVEAARGRGPARPAPRARSRARRLLVAAVVAAMLLVLVKRARRTALVARSLNRRTKVRPTSVRRPSADGIVVVPVRPRSSAGRAL